MQVLKGSCPKCGNPVVLTEYGRCLRKEFKGFGHSYEGWCSKCSEHVVEHSVPEKSERCQANEAKPRISK
jgi:endogenous inhibitor of DNA gyrase (YacG/DUF329 family)